MEVKPEFQSLINENEREAEENSEFAITASDPFIGASPARSPPLPATMLSSLPAWEEECQGSPMDIPEFQNLTIENECEVEENYELALAASDQFVGASRARSPPLPDALLSALGVFPAWDEECQGSPVEEIPEFQSSTNENEWEAEKNPKVALIGNDPFFGASYPYSPLLPAPLLSSLPAVSAWKECLLQECQGSPVEEILEFLSSTNENEHEVEKRFDFGLPTDDPFIGASPAQSPPLLPTSPLSSLPAVPTQEEESLESTLDEIPEFGNLTDTSELEDTISNLEAANFDGLANDNATLDETELEDTSSNLEAANFDGLANDNATLDKTELEDIFSNLKAANFDGLANDNATLDETELEDTFSNLEPANFDGLASDNATFASALSAQPPLPSVPTCNMVMTKPQSVESGGLGLCPMDGVTLEQSGHIMQGMVSEEVASPSDYAKFSDRANNPLLPLPWPRSSTPVPTVQDLCIQPQFPCMEDLQAPSKVPESHQDIVYPVQLYSQEAKNSEQSAGGMVMKLSNGCEQNLPFVGLLNGEKVFAFPPEGHVFPVNESQLQRPVEVQQDTHKIPYVKKPPNAFMLFMKAQRPNIAPELWRKGSGAVNAVLGKMWKSLSKEEQSKYFLEAEAQRMLHKLEHPEWTNRENYGKRRMKEGRKRSIKNPTGPQAKRKNVRTEPTEFMYPPYPQPHVMGQYLPRAYYMQNPPRAYYMQNPPQASYMQNPPWASYMQNPPRPTYTQNPTQAPYMQNPPRATYMLNPCQSSYMQNPPQASYVQNPLRATYMQNPCQSSYIQNPSHVSYMQNPPQAAFRQNPQATFRYNSPQAGHIQNPLQAGHIQNPPQAFHIQNPPQAGHIQNPPQAVHIQNPPQAGHIQNHPQTAYMQNSRTMLVGDAHQQHHSYDANSSWDSDPDPDSNPDPDSDSDSESDPDSDDDIAHFSDMDQSVLMDFLEVIQNGGRIDHTNPLLSICDMGEEINVNDSAEL